MKGDSLFSPGHDVEGVELVVHQVVHLLPRHACVDLLLGLEQIADCLVKAGHLLVEHLVVVNNTDTITDFIRCIGWSINPPLEQNSSVLHPGGYNLNYGWRQRPRNTGLYVLVT